MIRLCFRKKAELVKEKTERKQSSWETEILKLRWEAGEKDEIA